MKCAYLKKHESSREENRKQNSKETKAIKTRVFISPFLLEDK